MRFFQFKQFQITDGRSAMKVGTDSVILGAWVPIDDVKSILDMGCGSGLLSLILAQRSSSANVVGVEIEEGAIQDACFNCEQSPWNDRISVIHDDIRKASLSSEFDLIVSNPPFFTDSLLPNNKTRAGARHDKSLSLLELLESAIKHMTTNGRFALVFPFDRERELLSLAEINGLYPMRILHTKNKPQAQIKRSFIIFSKSFTKNIQIDLLEIRNEDAEYSSAYKKLTKDFYLKF